MTDIFGLSEKMNYLNNFIKGLYYCIENNYNKKIIFSTNSNL